VNKKHVSGGRLQNNYVMCNLGLHFNIWDRSGGGSEYVSTRTCDDGIRWGENSCVASFWSWSEMVFNYRALIRMHIILA